MRQRAPRHRQIKTNSAMIAKSLISVGSKTGFREWQSSGRVPWSVEEVKLHVRADTSSATLETRAYSSQILAANKDLDRSKSRPSQLRAFTFYEDHQRDEGRAFIFYNDPIFVTVAVVKSDIEVDEFSFREHGYLTCCPSHKLHDRNRTSGKLINCEKGTIVRADTPYTYVTLSYIWGKMSNLKVERRAGQAKVPQELPAVLLDAIGVTKALGFRYLWVDQLCIDQEDEASYLVQLQRVGNIYCRGAVTLVAATSDGDAASDLPGPRHPQDPARQFRSRSTTWNTRAWTYQEAVLSKRLLFSMDEGVYFKHGDLQRSESRLKHRSFGIGPDSFMRDSDDSDYEYYHFEVSKFTNRNMSNPQDSLSAFLGVLNLYKSASCDSELGYLTLYGLPVGLYMSEISWSGNSGIASSLRNDELQIVPLNIADRPDDVRCFKAFFLVLRRRDGCFERVGAIRAGFDEVFEWEKEPEQLERKDPSS
ncbi:uncharacterized protein PAC_06024 [Phialocephala subalpina]|uniref:Heterokaryon incompatibility domain-containing protein n=1 Tax=Phialocephala subalpina TaxID=576137 RepID=A0A1L7WTQ0_9HELO|nr:uncharacterized protein PAC_06024 [Phialocephala subalpina]